MLKLTIDGQNYKIRFSTLVLTDSDIITKLLDDSVGRGRTAADAMAKIEAIQRETELAQKENREPDVDVATLEATMTDMYKGVYDSALNAMRLTAEMLAAGLQKYHKDEFGYYIDDPDDPDGIPVVDDKLKTKAIRKCYDLIDAYEDDATDEQREKGEHDSAELYGILNDELVKNGFLSRLNRNLERAETNITKIPMDHQKKKTTKRQRKAPETKATESES